MAKGKVTEILANPALKKDGSPLSGTGKNGQPWSMSRVKAELDNGTTQEGNVFNPVSVGDELEAEYNEQYSSWNFNKVKPPKQVSGQEALMINMLKDIGEAVGAKFAVKEITNKPEKVIAQEAEESMDDEVDLSSIPF